MALGIEEPREAIGRPQRSKRARQCRFRDGAIIVSSMLTFLVQDRGMPLLSPSRSPLRFVSWPTEKRRALRRAVGLRARLRQAGLPQFDVDLEDLSTDGFRMQTGVMLLPGRRVWLTLPTFRALEATVAWQDGYRYGCQFEAPLHVAVFDHVVRRSAPRPASASGPAAFA